MKYLLEPFFPKAAHIQQCGDIHLKGDSYSQLRTNFCTVVAHTISYLCESVDT